MMVHLSFVAWLHVPFKLENERKMPNCKNSRTVELASTFQFDLYYSIGYDCELSYVCRTVDGKAKIVMFPAKLLHIVYPFQTSDDYRISIAGNLH